MSSQRNIVLNPSGSIKPSQGTQQIKDKLNSQNNTQQGFRVGIRPSQALYLDCYTLQKAGAVHGSTDAILWKIIK